MKTNETTKYIHRTKFAPQRSNNQIDRFDILFDSKEDYVKWNKDVTIGLAELDCLMNYCKYFQREKGNDGYYVRDGKSIRVNGTFTAYDLPPYFKDFLKDNNWQDNWFELMDRYKTPIPDVPKYKLKDDILVKI